MLEVSQNSHATIATLAERPADRARGLVRAMPWLALVWAISWFALLGAHPLFNPDEGRYAEIPREMLASGEWLVPRLNGLIYIEKPPLQYWATAASMAVFGSAVWSLRLYTGVCGFLTVLVVWGLAYRLWGRESAWRAGIIAASSMLTVLLSHHLTLDTSLTFFLTLSLAGFCLAQQHRSEPTRSRHWMWLAWTSAALALLTKGLIALVLPALTLALYSVLQGDRIVWRRLSVASGLPLFLLIAAPWFWFMQRELPQFLEFFFVREHFARYFTLIEERYAPWWFFIPVLGVGSLPWIVPLGRTILGGWRRRAPRGEFDARRFLWLWAVVVFCFFSASESKLIPYIQPMMPALALLIASGDSATLQRDLRLTALVMTIAALTFITVSALPSATGAHLAHAALFDGLRPYGIAMAVLAICGGVLALRNSRNSLALLAIIGTAGYLCIASLLLGARTVAPLFSDESLAAQLPHPLADNVPVFSVRTYDQTLPFYLRRTVLLVEERGELAFGQDLEPGRQLPSLEAFESHWRSGGQALAVMEPVTYAELKGHGLPMVVRATGVNRLIVSRE